MIGILHRYVLRELLKNFALTAIGLTLMFGMGGGLFNLIRIDQISPGDVARLLLWFIPLVASFMLPIAALLSCALVYGRLAADNELDACKASGINILRLLGSAIGLAIVVGAFSFWLSNYKVPQLFQRIDEIAQHNIEDMVVAKLKDQGHLSFTKNYIIYADDARKLNEEETQKVLGENDPRKQVVLIEKAAFIEFREDDPVRTGTAEQILLVFDKSKTPMSMTIRTLRARIFDHQRLQFTSMASLPLGLQQLPAFLSGSRMRLKFLDLSELLYYQDHPSETPAVQGKLKRFRLELAGLSEAAQILDSMRHSSMAVLKSPSGQEYRIRAKRAKLDDQARRPRLELLEPTIEQVEGKHVRIYRASKGDMTFQANSDKQNSPDSLTISFVLRDNVTLHDPQETSKPVQQPTPFEPPSVQLPLDAVPNRISYSDEQILNPALELPLPASLQQMRKDRLGDIRDIQRQITAAIHSRLTMSASTLVLVLLAAALGILLRGGHALTAFGVAFVPTVIVVLVITTGRQLAENNSTAILGLATMWGVIALMALVDAAIVFRCIRR